MFTTAKVRAYLWQSDHTLCSRAIAALLSALVITSGWPSSVGITGSRDLRCGPGVCIFLKIIQVTQITAACKSILLISVY
jgi:hypothetical protein